MPTSELETEHATPTIPLRWKSLTVVLFLTLNWVVLRSVLPPIWGIRPVIVVSLIAAYVLCLWVTDYVRISKGVLLLIPLLAGTASLYAALTGRWVEALSPIFVIASVFLVSAASMHEIKQSLRIATVCFTVLLIGSWIGLIVAAQGVDPILRFDSMQGRPYWWFYTTITHSGPGPIIRPSGIYDEAGMFSLLVCALAASRHLCGMNRRGTWRLLLMGFVTLSLAHLVYVTVHLLAEKKSTTFIVSLAAVLTVLIVIATTVSPIQQVFDERWVKRFQLATDAERVVAGDSRMESVIEGFRRLRSFGFTDIMVGNPGASDSTPGSNTFLEPLIKRGLLGYWLYYGTLAMLLFLPLWLGKKQFLVLIGLAALLLQRPDIYIVSYWFVIAVTYKLLPFSKRQSARSDKEDIVKFSD